MAFNDTFRESIQTKHIANVGFSTTAKGVSNETDFVRNPHQVIASQIPAVDVVGTYGDFVAAGISAGLVEKHIIKLTSDPSVNNNMAWFATEDNCTEAGHSARGSVRVQQWMRYTNTEYKLRLYEDTGSNAPDYTAEIFPSESQFNWEYDASTGIVYFDEDPSSNGKTLPLWAEVYTYVGESVEDGLGASSSGVNDLVEMFEDTNEPSGFVDRTSSTITFDDASRNLTISGASFSYYIEGEKYTKTGAESVQITATEGMHYVYYDDSTLSHTATFTYDLIYNKAYVAAIYWDDTNSTAIYMGDERHGITMDGQTHAYLHSAFGTQYIDGLAVTDITSNGNGTSNDHSTVGYTAGHIRDEDVLHALPAETSPATIPVFYKDGASGDWRMIAANNYPLIDNHSGATLPKWNEWTGATWQLTEVASDGLLMLSHIFATNDINNPVIAIAGQSTYATVAAAREGANNEINDLILTGMPFVEFTPIGTLIFMVSSTYTNTPKARIITDADGNDYVDWRFSGYSPNPQSVSDHANLTGRDVANSHPAAAISVDVSNFDGALGPLDAQVQTALESLDDAVQANSDSIITTASGLQVSIDQNASDISQNSSDITNNYNTLDNKIDTTASGLQVDIDQNSTDITNNYNTLDTKIDTTSGTLQDSIDALGEARDEFIELVDTIDTYNDGRILFESADAVIDDANLTYVSGTQTLNAPNVGILTDLAVGGNATVDGTFGFDTGTTINEFITTVDSGGTDDQVPTAKAVYDDVYTPLDTKIDTTSGTLQSEIDDLDTSLTDSIIWEVVDTPSDQIRPKVEHQGKAIYSAGNLTIGGDLTVSGTTTTVHSEELTVADKVITVNAGETGAGITGSQYAGIEVDRGSETDYMFVFDEVQDNFRVGISGSLQAVATREDTPIDTRVPYWNDSDVRFDTSGDDYITVSSGIDMYASTVNVLSLDETSQTFGDVNSTYINIDETGLAVSDDSVEVLFLDEDSQRFGKDADAGRIDLSNTGVISSIGTTEVLSLEETAQTLGVSGDTNIALDQTADSVVVTAGNVEVMSLTDTIHRIGTTADTNLEMNSDNNRITGVVGSYEWLDVGAGSSRADFFAPIATQDNAGSVRLESGAVGLWAGTGSAAATRQIYLTDAGMQLASGADVNEILNVTDGDFISSASTDDQLATAALIYYTTDTLSGTLQTDIDDAIADLANNYYNKTELDGGQLDNRYYTETEIDATVSGINSTISSNYSTLDSKIDTTSGTLQTYIDNIAEAQNEFLELEDVEVASYTAGNVLFTTASGVTDNSSFSYDSGTGTLDTTALTLGTGGSVNEIVTTVTSGTTDSMLPTAKAVWDLTEAAAAAVHSHYDVDATRVTDTEWTYDGSFSEEPDGLQLFVNGVKQRIGSEYDCTVAVAAGVLTITFNYSVRTDDWVNVNYYA